MSVEQALPPESSKIAVQGAAIRHRLKLAKNIVRGQETTAVSEDVQNLQLGHLSKLKLVARGL